MPRPPFVAFRSSLLLAGFGWLVLSLAMVSCSQGTGDRCEYIGDCVSGDICTGATESGNGICMPANTSEVFGTGGATGTGGVTAGTGGATGTGGDTGSMATDGGTDQMSVAPDADVDTGADATADIGLDDAGSD